MSFCIKRVFRYIEVFRSTMAEAARAASMCPPGGGGGGGNSRGMRSMGGGGGYGGYGGGPPRRPGPYDRGPPQPLGRGYGNFGPGGGGGGGGRMSRNFKGGYGGGGNFYDDDFDGYGGRGGGGFGGGSNFGGFGGGGGGGFRGGPQHIVRMRGLPFRVTQNDIAEWFSSVADPVDIIIRYNNAGRPTGDAEVMFASDGDARRALSKDKQNMQHRYIELFYDAPNGGGDGSGFGNGGGGGGAGGMPSAYAGLRGEY